ncbi:hypothetical protein E1301_Tti011959 [Triplophysa tibetana]|uniref:Uncharacterized protein n=1 Tax=Triplophysa tibetana TaxID=1572043 RepID=A0A5A9PJL8_9TELE|nr:hypothetical protein E1301_Tti011959 [Triplophysa tibetana]
MHGGVVLKITMEENIPIIILSDDDDDADESMTLNDSSVLFVENENNETEISKHIEQVDEDLAITYTQTGTVLPHARYDCTLHFCRADQDVSGPLQQNATYCDQCFCYVCDKQVSICEFWTTPGICHCNAHKHSVYWKALRDKSLMGYLHELNFAFDPLDMDSDLRHAETSLKQFAGSLAMKYAVFLMGSGSQKTSVNCRCNCHRINDNTAIQAGCKGCQKHHLKVLSFNYSPVSQHIQMFLQEAMKENPKACIVMLLGTVKIFISHSAPGNTHAAFAMSDAVTLLQWSLHVLPWDDPLLSAVIKGQNITGERHIKGRRVETLWEPLGLIEARVCRLQQLNKYRELARYLKVVKSPNIPQLQRLKDFVPLFLCKFRAYLRILTSGHAPKIENPQSDSGNVNTIMLDHLLATEWTPVEGSNLKRMEVLKFALRVLDCNNAVFADTESWVYLLSVVSSSHIAQDGLVVAAFYEEPDVNFQTVTRGIANSILQELTATSRIQISKSFENGYPDQSRLLLATQALVLRILHSQFSPILTVILSFRVIYSFVYTPRLLLKAYTLLSTWLFTFLGTQFFAFVHLHNRLYFRIQFNRWALRALFFGLLIASLSQEKRQILQQIQIRAAYPHPE